MGKFNFQSLALMSKTPAHCYSLQVEKCSTDTFNAETDLLEAAVTQDLLSDVAVLNVLEESIQRRTVDHYTCTAHSEIDTQTDTHMHTHTHTHTQVAVVSIRTYQS